jgi:enoyl-CoA hydratase
MKTIVWEITNQVAVLTVNRPEALNALNTDVLLELLGFLSTTALQEKVRVVILTGAGSKAFIAGADIKEMQNKTAFQMEQFCALGQLVANTLETAPFVTMAAVNGYALGGGLEIALGCDFIYASKKALLGLPEVHLGIIPGFGGTQRLPRAVGSRLAKEMILNGLKISAEDAAKIGLVNHVSEPEKLLEHCLKTAEEIAKNSPSAIREAKRAINSWSTLGLEAALEEERKGSARCLETEESKNAILSFTRRKSHA